MNRTKAFLIHLGCSALIAAAMLCIVFLVWYPAPLHKAVGVTEIFLILIAVDVVLGPLLTLVVFKQGKKSLKFDLSVIAMLQVAALTYGMYTVAIGRPAYIVFNKDRFDVVRAFEVDAKSRSNASAPYKTNPWFGPQYVVASVPKGDEKRREEVLFSALEGGPDVPQMPDLYSPYENSDKTQVTGKARDLTDLVNHNVDQEKTRSIISQFTGNEFAFLPMRSSNADMAVVVRKANGEIAKIVDLRPWP